MDANKPFGFLFTLDLYECKEGVCDDIALCYDFLERLVDELRMQKQSPPFIFRSDRNKYPGKAGLSGWVPLIESGIQIHTLSAKNFISIDIYSCGPFRTERLAEFVRAFFQPDEVETNLIPRGKKYYHSDVIKSRS
ncbi:MAG: S-adenosylmethionine decarboxylase [Verrucomicrobiota bacterium]|jgi:S-adenosylmethionine decarboxylase